MKDPKEAVIYSRFSPRPDANESESLNVQIERCNAYCTMIGLHVIKVFKDPEVSARTVDLADRPSGAEMLDFIKAYKVKNIVVLRIDRIFRNSDDGHSTMSKLRSMGVSVHLADQGGLSMCSDTAIGQFVLSILLGAAALEPALTAERTSKALRYKSHRNIIVSRVPPFGYERDPNNRGKMRPLESEQKVIRKIVEMTNSNHDPSDIASWLNQRGLVKRTKVWRPSLILEVMERYKSRQEIESNGH